MTLSKLKQEGREEFVKTFCWITSKRFWLIREDDVSGVSGIGVVADGVIFPNGTCVLRWRTAGGSTAVYDSIEQLEKIHGHEGKTKIEYLNEDEKIHTFLTAQIEKAYLSALSDVEKEVISLAVYSGQDCGAKHQFNIVQDKQRQALNKLKKSK